MFGMFDDLFDFNHDGELDSFERAAAVTSMAYSIAYILTRKKAQEPYTYVFSGLFTILFLSKLHVIQDSLRCQFLFPLAESDGLHGDTGLLKSRVFLSE